MSAPQTPSSSFATVHLPVAVTLLALFSGAFLMLQEARPNPDQNTTAAAEIRCLAGRLKGTELDATRHVQAPTLKPSI
jgi:hypothetical protein